MTTVVRNKICFVYKASRSQQILVHKSYQIHDWLDLLSQCGEGDINLPLHLRP